MEKSKNLENETSYYPDYNLNVLAANICGMPFISYRHLCVQHS